MKNREIARIFYEIADMLEMQDVQFKPRAYRKAAQNIESLSEDIEEIYKRGELEKIPGVGKSIAEKVKELIEKGSLAYYEKLKKEIPVNLEELSSVEGLGPKMIKLLYKELGVKNLNDLERVAKEGKIRHLKGMGEKTEQKILENIEFARKKGGRVLLGFALPEAMRIIKVLEKDAERISLAGSLRRKKETIGDMDILAISSNSQKLMDKFTSMKEVEKVLAKGETKSSIRLKSGIQVDLRIVDKKSFGSALQYFTGSKEHNIEIRKIAVRNKYKLNEYGLFEKESGKKIAGETEEEVYKALGMQYIPPELRENRGEVEAALNGKLPSLVEREDVKGDLQMHTKWSDGAHTIEEMVKEAIRLGHSFIAITDHIGTLKIAGGMGEEEIRKQMKEIALLNEKYDDFRIFHGVEVNILKDGSLDMSRDVLKDIDVVIASIHSAFRQPMEEMTERLLKALENDVVDILAHPTARIIYKREGIKFDVEKVFDAAKENEVILEINAQPDRLDLNDILAKKAIEQGLKLSIGTDAHNKESLRYIELGLAVARRAWAEKKDIVNTYSIKELEKIFSK
ncbi:MAG: DNA polymerase/3'-5' exonuclease PolX [Thermoplasmata archaeon]|nr:MAG: DNA polymerase/3'-5' exonuclease PolX [Thermoplasmata archaeon]